MFAMAHPGMRHITYREDVLAGIRRAVLPAPIGKGLREAQAYIHFDFGLKRGDPRWGRSCCVPGCRNKTTAKCLRCDQLAGGEVARCGKHSMAHHLAIVQEKFPGFVL